MDEGDHLFDDRLGELAGFLDGDAVGQGLPAQAGDLVVNRLIHGGIERRFDAEEAGLRSQRPHRRGGAR